MFVSDAAGVSLTVLGYSNGITLCPQGSLLFVIWIENIFCIQCIAVTVSVLRIFAHGSILQIPHSEDPLSPPHTYRNTNLIHCGPRACIAVYVESNFVLQTVLVSEDPVLPGKNVPLSNITWGIFFSLSMRRRIKMPSYQGK